MFSSSKPYSLFKEKYPISPLLTFSVLMMWCVYSSWFTMVREENYNAMSKKTTWSKSGSLGFLIHFSLKFDKSFLHIDLFTEHLDYAN